jgi:homocysteine S-methyltransferase
MRSAGDLPIVVYPNAGGEWDAIDGQWHGATLGGTRGAFPDALVREWLDAGVRGVGGCCGTDARAVSRIAQLLAL